LRDDSGKTGFLKLEHLQTMIYRLLILSTILVFSAVKAQPDLSGIWMLKGRVTEGDLRMTSVAERIQADYDLLEDDPSLFCEPASLSRVWANPNVRIAFDPGAEKLTIKYEFYDLRREIPIGGVERLQGTPSTKNVEGTLFSTMGSSFARYDENAIFIETRNHTPGYIRTSRGIPQSENSISTEKLWIDEGVLRLTLSYVDDSLFEVPFVMEHEFHRIEGSDLPLYNCTDADYDWFEALNTPNSGDSQ
jgi:hypothetical protein